jgi:hypothetical protein
MSAAASLLFAPGQRPDAAAIRAFARTHDGFAVSLDPQADGGPTRQGPASAGAWLELIANGLTFDLEGLAPGRAAEVPPRRHAYRLEDEPDLDRLEAVGLRPGPHLSAGGRLLPVVRTLAGLAARLAALPGALAVAWHPSHSWCAAGHFRDSVLRWTDGGVFPAFALAALSPNSDGSIQSEGLALLIGQELRLESELAQDRAAGAKMALRLLHWLAENGPIQQGQPIVGPEGEPLRLEPSENGRFVRVWKG